VAYFVAPTAVVYITLGEPLVAALFERGEFNVSDTRLVWLVLAAYSLGLLASTASRLLQNSLYALDDPRTPARIALVRVVTSTLAALSVMFLLDRVVLVGTSIQVQGELTDGDLFLHLGAVGIALGSALGAWVELTLLRLALRWRIGPVDLGGGSLGIVVTGALAGAAVGRIVDLFVGGLPAILAAGAAIGVAGLVYLAFTTACGLPLRTMVGR
jgi:putative peptidoglycan lipid II flippase